MLNWLRRAWTNYITGATERFEGYRTHIFAGLIVLLGIIELVDPYTIASIIPWQYQGWFLMGIGALTALLRQITKTESPIRFTRRKREAHEPGAGTYVYEPEDGDGGDGGE
jgi:hypothetical protein